MQLIYLACGFPVISSANPIDCGGVQRSLGVSSGQNVKILKELYPQHQNMKAAHICMWQSLFLRYVRRKLCETQQEEVELKSVEKDALEALVKYIYTGRIHISHRNVQALLAAANLIQMKDVKQLCCDFLEQHLDTTNCLGITHFAETHACDQWAVTARKFCAQHFEALKYADEFLQLESDNLKSLLLQEDLAVPCEESVLATLLVWVEFDQRQRVEHLEELLRCIKLPLMTLSSLQKQLESNKYFQSNGACLEQLCKAIHYHLNPEERIQWRVSSPYMFVPREPPKRMCAVGGKNGLFATLKSFEICSSEHTEWKEATPLNCRRQECAAAVVNKCLYIIGGIKCYTRNGTTFRRHDNSVEKWTSKSKSGFRWPR
ncbi:putative kelch-like protein 28 [Apostichopus japonicus]|uniref:Putative kelch-like protein 28 n=1 Tax=Stichopus japonicus TaxID=307972 RepID=A0A2G8JCY4_STIJA|nr:putative kelch-like protein 28 [Apostichopus japonicus]